MSGIFGCCGPPRLHAATLATALGHALRHERWHTCEVTSPRPGVAVGVRGFTARATGSIASTPDGRVLAIVSGPVYEVGSRRLRGTEQVDSAALVAAAYASGGVSALRDVDGEHALVVWDDDHRRLLLGGNRFGLVPTYWHASASGLVFGPELRALVAAGDVPARPDETALAEYFRFQQILGDRTWLADVSLVPPGRVLVYHQATGAVQVERLWHWRDIRSRAVTSRREAVRGFSERLQAAVDVRAETDGRVGVYLSGGIDSRTVLGFLQAPEQAETITYGAAGCLDVRIASRVAEALGCRHQWFPFESGTWVLDHLPMHLTATEGFHAWHHSHGISTLEPARTSFDVELNGFAGNLLKGRVVDYAMRPAFREAAEGRDLAPLLFECLRTRLTWPGLTDEEAAALAGRGTARAWSEQARASCDAHVLEVMDCPPHRRVDVFYMRHHVLRSTVNHLVLHRHALDVRCPLADADLVDFALSLPDEHWATPDFPRDVLTGRRARLARIVEEGTSALPHSSALLRSAHKYAGKVRRRTARALGRHRPSTRLYADYENYLRGDLRPWAEALLFDERTLARGFYDPAALRALWDRHVSGRELHTIGKIAPLMTIEMTLRYLVDGDAAPGACGLAATRA